MTDLDPATPRPSGTRADAPPRTDVALRPVAADDADFLWTWIHGAEDPEWKSWDAPY
ncbi:N-acetyltransferase, partial [Xanthomonas citri pv. citri]|nr:N-acetyltransferase [Xanthomonas citri pv. citri]